MNQSATENESIDTLTIFEFESRKEELKGQKVRIQGNLGSHYFPDNCTLPDVMKLHDSGYSLLLQYKDDKKPVSDSHMIVNLMANTGQEVHIYVRVCEETAIPMLYEMRVKNHASTSLKTHNIYKF